MQELQKWYWAIRQVHCPRESAQSRDTDPGKQDSSSAQARVAATVPPRHTQGAVHSSTKSAYSNHFGSFQNIEYKVIFYNFLPALSVINCSSLRLYHSRCALPT